MIEVYYNYKDDDLTDADTTQISYTIKSFKIAPNSNSECFVYHILNFIINEKPMESNVNNSGMNLDHATNHEMQSFHYELNNNNNNNENCCRNSPYIPPTKSIHQIARSHELSLRFDCLHLLDNKKAVSSDDDEYSDSLYQRYTPTPSDDERHQADVAEYIAEEYLSHIPSYYKDSLLKHN
jgi:hypothetical protein